MFKGEEESFNYQLCTIKTLKSDQKKRRSRATVRNKGSSNTIHFFVPQHGFSVIGQRAFGPVQHTATHTGPLSAHSHIQTGSEIN